MAVHYLARAGSFTPPTPTAAPVNQVAPVITGGANVGDTLSVSNGQWTQFPTSFTYQWNSGGVPISGETGGTHIIQTGETAITCDVTATNSIGSTTQTSSNSITPSSGGGGTTGGQPLGLLLILTKDS